MNHVLTPSLATVAARLVEAGVLPRPPDQRQASAGEETDAAAEELRDEDAAASQDWRQRPLPPGFAQQLERAATGAALAARPIGAGQIHALPALPGMASVLLDRWQAQHGQWRGWVVTPDPAYAGPADLVLEARDAPLDPRAALVLSDWPIMLAPARLGTCIGVLSQERLRAVRALQRDGGASQSQARPGVVARVALEDGDYALTGSALLGDNDPRLAYRALLRQGLAHIGASDAAALEAEQETADVTPATPARGSAANSGEVGKGQAGRKQASWVNWFAAVAASVAVLQFGWMQFMQNDPAQQAYRGGIQQAAGGPTVRVLFRAEATEAEIRDWLQREQIEIVNGPDLLGAFTLRRAEPSKPLPAPGPGNPLARVNPE